MAAPATTTPTTTRCQQHHTVVITVDGARAAIELNPRPHATVNDDDGGKLSIVTRWFVQVATVSLTWISLDDALVGKLHVGVLHQPGPYGDEDIGGLGFDQKTATTPPLGPDGRVYTKMAAFDAPHTHVFFERTTNGAKGSDADRFSRILTFDTIRREEKLDDITERIRKVCTRIFGPSHDGRNIAEEKWVEWQLRPASNPRMSMNTCAEMVPLLKAWILHHETKGTASPLPALTIEGGATHLSVPLDLVSNFVDRVLPQFDALAGQCAITRALAKVAT